MPVKYRLTAYFAFLCILLSAGLADGYWELLKSGEDSFLKGDLDQSEMLFEKVFEVRPQDPRILSGLGRVYFHKGKFSAAEEMLAEALKNDSVQDWVHCWSNLYMGRLLGLRNEYDKAAVYFLNAETSAGSNNCNQDAVKYSAYYRIMDAKGRLTSMSESRCCIIHYGDNFVSSEDASSLIKRGQEFYEKVVASMKIAPDTRRIGLYIFPSEYSDDLWDAREIIAKENMDEVYLYFNGFDDMGHLEHEMAHIITAGLFNMDHIMPLLSEGVAEYLAGDPWGISLDKWARGFMINDEFIPLVQLLNTAQFRMTNPILSYSEGGSFVKYLIDRYGVSRFQKIISGPASWDAVYNKSFEELEGEWMRSISSEKVTEAEMSLITRRLQMGAMSSGGRE